MLVKKSFLICLVILFAFINGYGQQKNYQNEFGFRSDNDSYLGMGKDRYYTNGLFINYRHAIKETKLKKDVVKKIWGIEVGQYMFNPQSGSISNINAVDRPFASYLYAAGKLKWFFRKERALNISVQTGTIGPAAFGEEAQKTLHQALGFYPIEGWQYQVKNEFGINTRTEYTALLSRSKSANTDISFNGYLNLGNTFSGAGAGVLFRTGTINPLYKSAATNSRISGSADSAVRNEFFFFAKPVLNYVAYDATIQGGLFRKDKGPVTYDPKRIVFSQELGVNYSRNRWTIDFSVILKSKEIKSIAKADQYGSLTFYYRFN